MVWGLSAHRVAGGESEVDRLRFARIADARGLRAPATAAAQPPHVQAILALHRHAGNRAVVQLLRRDRTGTTLVAQRQDEDEEAGQSWATDETASQSSGGADYSSGEAYGPPAPPTDDGGGQGWASASGEATPAQEPTGGGDGGGEASGGGGEPAPAQDGGGDSWWSSGGGGGEEAPGPETPTGGDDAGGAGGGEPAGESDGGSSWWPLGGGGEETPRNRPGEAAPGEDEGGGSSWWPFGGGGDEPAGGGDDGGGSSWWPFGGGDESGEGEGEQGDFSPEEMQEKLDEGEIAPVQDAPVAIRSSPIYTRPPGPGPAQSGFHDGGRSKTVPFGSLDDDDLRREDPNVPHAITVGGRTGTVAWSGGGKAGGPRGHPGTGIPSTMVEPKYDTAWNGPFAYASAWVIPGTGVFDIHRTYESSNAGDQGNGWWVSSRAAAALEAHEVRHIEAAKSVYASKIEPLLDRIAKSKTTGYHTNYLASHAVAVLQQNINWKKSIDRFVEEDAQWNADGGQIDTEDYVSPSYPAYQNGPRTIEGKSYDKYLVMRNEEPPP